MKNKMLWLWLLWIACVAGTVGLWFMMNKVELKYDEVDVKVISSTTKRLKNKKNGNSYDFYEVKVEYNGKTYDLENAHNTYSYPKGKKVKAYLANDKLYANIEGVKTATPTATIYFIFLFASFGLLFFNCYISAKEKQKKLNNQAEVKEETKEDIKIESKAQEEQEDDKPKTKAKKTTKTTTKKINK